jgi:hypothetical protein
MAETGHCEMNGLHEFHVLMAPSWGLRKSWSSTFRLSDVQHKLTLELQRDVPTKERHYRGPARSRISVTRIFHAPTLRGMAKKEPSYRPGKRQTRFVLSLGDIRSLGAPNAYAVNHYRPSQPLCLLPAGLGE